jgi:RNA polymerase sigma-70 factor (ECF subfamily)
MPLLPAFAAKLRSADRLAAVDPEALEALLAATAAQGRTAWPGLALEDEAFVAFVAERLPGEGDVKDLVADLPAADLYLACACAHGIAAAVEAFDRRYFGDVDAVLARIRVPGATADDVRQMLREKLFVATAEGPPRIAEYSGKGALAGWFRVTATRLALNLTRGKREDLVDDERLLEVEAIVEKRGETIAVSAIVS